MASSEVGMVSLLPVSVRKSVRSGRFEFFGKCERDYALYVLFFQAEDGIRALVRSRGLGDVYKRQSL